MSKKTPTAADTAEVPDDLPHSAQRLLVEIQAASQAMAALGKAPQTGDMAQLVLKRGKLIDALLALPLEKLSETERMTILAELEAIRKLDNQVNEAMAGIVQDIERQLRGCHDGKQVLQEYRIESDPERKESTRSDHA